MYRAAHHIDAGDILTFSYLGEERSREPTEMRRNYLFATKRFWCRCPRCSMPDATRVLPCGCGKSMLHCPLSESPWSCVACGQTLLPTSAPAQAEARFCDTDLVKYRGQCGNAAASLSPMQVATMIEAARAAVTPHHFAYATLLHERYRRVLCVLWFGKCVVFHRAS